MHFSAYGVLYRGGPAKPTTAVGSGTFSGTPAFSASGQAFVVFSGGSTDQLEAAAAAVEAKGVWAQDANGRFTLLVVRGPAFLRKDFDAGFPSGFATTVAMTLVR